MRRLTDCDAIDTVRYRVTITGMLLLTVEVYAVEQLEVEQTVSYD